MSEWLLTDEEMIRIQGLFSVRNGYFPGDWTIAKAQLKKVAKRLKEGVSRENLLRLYEEAGLEEVEYEMG